MYNKLKNPYIVALGGGTGLSVMLRGLKKATPNITAIVTVSDNGGSSGILRQDMNMVPPGDIRDCLVALANTEPVMEKLLQYRFENGVLAGQNFGNLFLAALSEISGGFEEAVRVTASVLAITGRVIPVTLEKVDLEAIFDNDEKVVGEIEIVECSKTTSMRIKDIALNPPNPEPMPDALEAIKDADAILLGPGSLYTSIIPNLLVKGIPLAIKKSKAQVIYICNIMTQPGETIDFDVEDHISQLEQYLGEGVIDKVIINSEKVSRDWLELYLEEGANLIRFSGNEMPGKDLKIIKKPVLKVYKDKGIIRHDSDKVTKIIMNELDK